MLLAKIVGTVVATRKDPRLEASKLMLAERAASSGARLFFTHIEGAYRVERRSGEAGRYNFNVERAK